MKKALFLPLIILFSVFLGSCSISDWNAKSGLQVQTSNSSASLFLDGKYLDKTPYVNKEMKPGSYLLEGRPDDSKLVPYQTTISLKKGVLTFMTWKPGNRPETSGGVIYEMESLPNTHDSQLSINTIPDGAIIRVDDQAKGFAPVLVEHISPGEHTYEVTLPSYETQKNTINVVDGFRMNVTVKLARESDEGVAVSPTASPSASPSASPGASPSASSTNSASVSANLKTTPIVTTATSSASPKVLGVTSTTSLPKPKAQVLPTGFTQDGKEVLRVREKPDAGANTIGYAPVGSEYPYLKVMMDGWYKITFNGKTGWLNSQYVQLFE